MSGRLHFINPVVSSLFYLCLLTATVLATGCDKSTCKGPLTFYEDLKCKPVYKKNGDCCASRYDCSHIENRSPKKCYANGCEYNIGERLKTEDRASPCNINCVCRSVNELATFSCAVVDCPENFGPTKRGCYYKHAADSCCDKIVCPENKNVKCIVNGTEYLDGEEFFPNDDLICQCSKDYEEGVYEAPYCQKKKKSPPEKCGIELYYSSKLYNKCAPVFYDYQKPTSDCNFAFRCQNHNDKVIKNAPSRTNAEKISNSQCIYGNMIMKIGEELNKVKGDSFRSDVCIKCVCEVPPMPTCTQVSFDQC